MPPVDPSTLKKVAVSHGVAVFVHLFLSFYIAFGDAFANLRDRDAVDLMVPGWEVTPTNASALGDVLISPCVKKSGVSLNLWLVTEIFNSVTTLAHLLYLCLCLWAIYRRGEASENVYPQPALKRGVFLGRWVEYSITAPAMLVLISVQIGARDLFLYLHGIVLTVLVMVTGGLVPQLYHPQKQRHRTTNNISESDPILTKKSSNTPSGQENSKKGCLSYFVGTEVDRWHLISWLLLVQSWVPIFGITRSGLQSARTDPANDAPVEVIVAVVICEFLFFSAFGVVETFKVRRERVIQGENLKKMYRRVEMSYIALSVTSKSLLIALTSVSLSQMPEFQSGAVCS